MTELFTVYNLPASTANFYHKFKGGTLPVGIGDVNIYIRLKYASPGTWTVGSTSYYQVGNDEGVTERWTHHGSASIISVQVKKDKV